jgi:PTH1 family peptidyl-tRNA hydrolase
LVVVFGVGNPGDGYDLTRHNIGKEVVFLLARSLKLQVRPGKGEFVYARDPARELSLVVPTRYVNETGLSVVGALDFFGAGPERLVVVFDDFNLPLGSIRIRKKGGDGGHNGLSSIIYNLGTQDFPRLRLGIGSPPPDTDPADFVLSRFPPGEAKTVERLKKEAAEALLVITDRGLDRAMNEYNKRAAE